MALDIKRAFLYGKAERPIFVRLPREDDKYGSPDLLWKLEKAMYGTRDAPSIWQKEVHRVLSGLSFVRSRYNTCMYYHPEKNITLLVHVDDFLVLGDHMQLKWVAASLEKEFELKRTILGPEPVASLSITFLGRTIRWTRDGLEYEADQKHVKTLLEERYAALSASGQPRSKG